MSKLQQKSKGSSQIKIEKRYQKPKMRRKYIADKQVVKGPPSKPEDFSENWKHFLSNQQNEKQINDKKKSAEKRRSSANKEKELNMKDGYKITGSKDNIKKVLKSHSGSKVMSNGNPYERKKNKFKDTTTLQGKANDIWFDDVDPELLGGHNKKCVDENDTDGEADKIKEKEENKTVRLTRYVAIDCEMVGVGKDGKESVLARVSVVNSLGECIYDQFVKTKEKVVDYRTHVSGVRSSDLKGALDYEIVQKEVSDLLKGRILVGHALQNDLKVLMLSHSQRNIRDTSRYKPFRKLLKTKRPALKKLAAVILNKEIQSGEHSSVIDARITMELYKKYKKEWEKLLRTKGESANLDSKEIFMSEVDVTKKRKISKWKKIKQRKNKKKDNE